MNWPTLRRVATPSSGLQAGADAAAEVDVPITNEPSSNDEESETEEQQQQLRRMMLLMQQQLQQYWQQQQQTSSNEDDDEERPYQHRSSRPAPHRANGKGRGKRRHRRDG